MRIFSKNRRDFYSSQKCAYISKKITTQRKKRKGKNNGRIPNGRFPQINSFSPLGFFSCTVRNISTNCVKFCCYRRFFPHFQFFSFVRSFLFIRLRIFTGFSSKFLSGIFSLFCRFLFIYSKNLKEPLYRLLVIFKRRIKTFTASG